MSTFKKYMELIHEVSLPSDNTSEQKSQQSNSSDMTKKENNAKKDKSLVSGSAKIGINLSMSNNKNNLMSIIKYFKNMKDMKGLNLNMIDDVVEFKPLEGTSQKEGIVYLTNMTFGLSSDSEFFLPVSFYSNYAPNKLIPLKKVFFVFKPLDTSFTRFEIVDMKETTDQLFTDKKHNFAGESSKVRENVEGAVKTPKDHVRIRIEGDDKNKKITIESNKAI
jgi:hypothetical protein